MLIDLVQLRTFVAVAEERHLTRAAERLHISQSAASTHVRGVEETLDTQLFTRNARGVELTRAGELLLSKARALLNEATLMSAFARELHGKIEGQLVIGSTSDPTSSKLGQVVAALRGAHPLVNIELRARPSASMLEGLKTGEFDIGLLLAQPTHAELAYYELTRLEFRVAASVRWKAQLENASWAELAALPWICPTEENQAYSSMLRQMFEQRGLKPNTIIRFDNAALGRAMLEAGVGLMLVREVHLAAGLQSGQLATSSLARATFPLFVAHAASRANDPLISAFLRAAGQIWPGLAQTPTHQT